MLHTRAWIVLLVPLAGCPSSGSADDDGGAGDLAAASADDMAVGGGASPDLAPAPNSGSILIESTNSSFETAASFLMGKVPTSSPACTVTFVGNCQAAACVLNSADAGTTGAVYTAVSGGTVTINGGAMPVTLTPMMFSGTTYYNAVSSTTAPLFAGGETLTVATSGAVAPAWSTTIVAPTKPTITAPVAGSSYTITRSNDFPVAWTGGGAGEVSIFVQANVSSTAPGTPYGSVRCTFPVADGHGTIPAAALAALPVGSASFQFGVINIVAATVGDWLMTASAVTFPLAPNGQDFGGGQATVN